MKHSNLESEALKQAHLQSAAFNRTLQDLQEMDPGDEQVEAAVRRLFLFKIVGQGDIATYLQFTRLGNESKKLALTQARQERLQQQRQDAPGGFEDEDPFNSRNLDRSPLLSPFSALYSNSGPSTPPAQDPIGAGTSRPRTMSQDSKLAPAGHLRPCPNAPCFDPASQPSSASSSAPTAPPSSCNSLKYLKTLAIRKAAFSLPDHPAPCPNSAGDTKVSFPSSLLSSPEGQARRGS